MQSVIVVASKFLIYSAVPDNVPGDDQHAMRDCECRFLTAAFYGYTSKQCGEVASFLRINDHALCVSILRRYRFPLHVEPE